REFRPAARFLSGVTNEVDFIVTANETEAFILENNLIKKHKPSYNIRLKDDKSFLCLRVDKKHPFPSIVPVRRPKRDGALYFGPYASAGSLRATLRILRTVVPLRDCTDREFKGRRRPCIKHQIGRCSAPCVGYIDASSYHEDLKKALQVLQGRVGPLIEGLEKEMASAAENMEYEKAGGLRDKIGHLKSFARSQQVENLKYYDVDVIGYWQQGGLAEVVVLFFREGKLLSSRAYTFEMRFDAVELIAQFLSRFYEEGRHIPGTTYIPLTVPDMKILASHLQRRRGASYRLKVARRGGALKLLKLAEENARLSLRTSQESRSRNADTLESLRRTLGLRRPPISIECIDISTTGGRQAVGAIVHYEHGLPKRARYRRYRIKTVEGMDDYAMIKEVITRRLIRGRKERDLPDLILIDGGRGQLNAAIHCAGMLKIESVAFAGICKGSTRARAVEVRKEDGDRIVLPDRLAGPGPEPGSQAMHLLQRIRDEAHRFAVTYHRNRRSKAGLSSPLDLVQGIGVDRKQHLLTRFGGLRGLKNATREELSRVPGVGPVLAERIHKALHP
ncbi:MAG: excinuclease ABC subunit UvrC, partial [Planctomycetes bacterium]|nr:excinuclease ABC subunit UvrC [Planctomycetota bacterium]